jgi:hypothetical protein
MIFAALAFVRKLQEIHAGRVYGGGLPYLRNDQPLPPALGRRADH